MLPPTTTPPNANRPVVIAALIQARELLPPSGRRGRCHFGQSFARTAQLDHLARSPGRPARAQLARLAVDHHREHPARVTSGPTQLRPSPWSAPLSGCGPPRGGPARAASTPRSRGGPADSINQAGRQPPYALNGLGQEGLLGVAAPLDEQRGCVVAQGPGAALDDRLPEPAQRFRAGEAVRGLAFD